ncbi:hypothetical protein V1512DRAFT_153086, partial [Lipomyces arxii]|uniref:uncharacterized protein n=1 Tax=Lipomyces arxii TaxID=56418 RepID=UPI0034CD26BF
MSDYRSLAQAVEKILPDLRSQRPMSFLPLTSTKLYSSSGTSIDPSLESLYSQQQAQSLCTM